MYWGRRWAKPCPAPWLHELVTGIFCIDGTAGQATVIVYDDFCRLAIASRGSSTLAPAFSSIGTRKGNT